MAIFWPLHENMREYDEYMLHTYKYHRRNVEKHQGKSMLGIMYQIISEMASPYECHNSPRSGNHRLPNEEDMIVRNSNRSPRGLYAVLMAPIGVLTQVMGNVRKLFVNGKQMRMASVLKAGKYRKNSK